MPKKWETPVRGQAQPGLGNRYATAAGTLSISSRKAKGYGAGTAYTVTPSVGEAFRIVVSGRDRWALDELRKAGAKGCTPIDNPAPRWAAYVHNLRALGVVIDTLHEPHAGDFPGTHGRYLLRVTVTPEAQGGAA